MELMNLIARLWQSGQRPAPAQRHRVRLEMESLEDRRLLSSSSLAAPSQLIAQAPAQNGPVAQSNKVWVYQVTHYTRWGSQRFNIVTERFNNQKAADDRAAYWKKQGYCTSVRSFWTSPPKAPVHMPVIHS